MSETAQPAAQSSAAELPATDTAPESPAVETPKAVRKIKSRRVLGKSAQSDLAAMQASSEDALKDALMKLNTNLLDRLNQFEQILTSHNVRLAICEAYFCGPSVFSSLFTRFCSGLKSFWSGVLSTLFCREIGMLFLGALLILYLERARLPSFTSILPSIVSVNPDNLEVLVRSTKPQTDTSFISLRLDDLARRYEGLPVTDLRSLTDSEIRGELGFILDPLGPEYDRVRDAVSESFWRQVNRDRSKLPSLLRSMALGFK